MLHYVCRRLVATLETVSDLPDKFCLDTDAISLEKLAAEQGVSVDALDGVVFPEHRRMGWTLARPAVLNDIDAQLEADLSYSEAEEAIAGWGISHTGSVLSTLGYEVKWRGLAVERSSGRIEMHTVQHDWEEWSQKEWGR